MQSKVYSSTQGTAVIRVDQHTFIYGVTFRCILQEQLRQELCQKITALAGIEACADKLKRELGVKEVSSRLCCKVTVHNLH